MTDQNRFARLTALACHDIRTPLATVFGFARTLSRLELEQPVGQYAEMIDQAAAQVGELLEELALVARIETGRFEPVLAAADSLELARTAVEELGEERVELTGEGAEIQVPIEETKRALVQLTRAAQRHGGLERVGVHVRGPELAIGPVTRTSAPVLLGEQLRELSAAAAAALVEAIGGSLRVEDDRLLVRLPQ